MHEGGIVLLRRAIDEAGALVVATVECRRAFYAGAQACVRLLVGCTDSPSFPSNHAVNATVLATLVTLSMPRLWFPVIVLAILVGYSRVYVGVHYPLDVLLGGLLGLVVALVLSWILTILWPFPSGLDHRRRTFSLTFRDREGRMD